MGEADHRPCRAWRTRAFRLMAASAAVSLIWIAIAAAQTPSPPLLGTGLSPPSLEPATAPAGSPAAVAGPAAPVDPETDQLSQVTRSADHLEQEAHKATSDEALAGLRRTAATTQARAEALAERRGRELTRLSRRLRSLSTAKGSERPNLTPAEHEERFRLLVRTRTLEGERRTAAHAASAASATYTAVSDRRRQDLDAKWLARTSSPLERDFWTGLAEAVEPDTARAQRVVEEGWRTALAAPEPQGVLAFVVGLACAVLLGWPIRRLFLHLARRRAREAGSDEVFRRFAHALTAVLIDTALPAAAAICIRLGLSWGGLLSPKAEAIAQAAVIAVVWGAAVVALARQLVGGHERAEGLVRAPRRLARSMRTLPWLVAVITGAGFLLSRLNNVIGASLAATIAANCVVSLAYAGAASLVLVALGADGRPEDDADVHAASPGRVLLSILLSVAVALTVGAVFTGYTTLAAIISSQLFWVSVLGAAVWLLLRFTDELCGVLFEPHGGMGRLLTGLVNLPGRTSQQLGAMTSALLQVLIILGALGLALTPFGRNGDVLTDHLDRFGGSLQLGSLVISPRSLGLGLLVLVAGLLLSRAVQRWVDRRFLPLTDWDVGVRASISTGVRYLTISAAVLWALAGMGLGFRQIALVAGALSVGIGFGLQQIVQNFVSGLILLIERPVKVGDWISLAGVEGDVRRIRVRATEIRLFDQSTLIVPNSDLITKQVENKTLETGRARLKLQVTINAAADAPKALKLMAQVLAASDQTLEDPKPGVFIDALTPTGNVVINAFAYVPSPRDAYRVRSQLYLEVIEAMGRDDIAFVGAGGQTVVLQPSDAMLRMVGAAAAAGPPTARRTEDDLRASGVGSPSDA